MSESNYAGIDYSRGTANFDKANGIHYGVISINALGEFAHEEFEADYGDPQCPKCGNEMQASDIVESDSVNVEADYYCKDCDQSYWSDACFGDEPVAWHLDDGEYTASLDEHNDVFLVKSPYYTYAQFCSPCAPGAGHLSRWMPKDMGAKTYCFGHEWFEGDEAPYPVYSVETKELVEPKKE